MANMKKYVPCASTSMVNLITHHMFVSPTNAGCMVIRRELIIGQG